MPGADDGQASQGQEAQVDQKNDQAGEQGQNAGESNVDHQEMSLEEAQAEIKKLRKENAARRTSNKALEERMQTMEGMQSKLRSALGLEDDKISPEEKANQLQELTQVQALQNEIVGIAYNAGIPTENFEYFQFLFDKKLSALEEGQELTEEDIDEVVNKARTHGGGSETQGRQRTGANGKAPKTQTEPQLTPETFSKMSIPQKSELYEKNPDLYTSLFKEAKQKGLLIQA